MNNNNITSSSNENILEPHDEDVDPQVALFLTGFTAILSLFVFVYFFFGERCPCCCCGFSRNKKYKVWKTAVAFLFLVTSIHWTAYAGSLYERDRQDYQGLMRIVGVTYEERVESHRNCNNNNYNNNGASSSSCTTTYSRHVDAVLELDWGYDWACGHHDAVSCHSTVSVCSRRICSSSSCDDDETASAHSAAAYCTRNGYFDVSAMPDWITYDPYVGPRTDVNWPSITAYGDCSRCSARLSVPSVTSLENRRTAGWALTAATAFFLVLGLVCETMAAQKRRRPQGAKTVDDELSSHGPSPNSIDREATIEESEVPALGAHATTMDKTNQDKEKIDPYLIDVF